MEYRYMKVEYHKEDKRLASTEKENIIVAGGQDTDSVQIFDWSKKTWSPLQSLPDKRQSATSFVHNNHLTLAGGFTNDGLVDDMITMNIDPCPDLFTHWSKCPAKLPANLLCRTSVVYKDQLIVSGGEKKTNEDYDGIHAVQLVPPYSIRLLSRMPEPRQNHRSEIFDDNLLVFGGETFGWYREHFSSVMLYDINRNQYKQLTPLPYPVSRAATVRWGDNVAIIGGIDKYFRTLDTVIIYNVKTEQSYLLPSMKFKREECTAVLIKNNIVVLGGMGEDTAALQSVETFNLASYTWEELPEMPEGRSKHCAVAV